MICFQHIEELIIFSVNFSPLIACIGFNKSGIRLLELKSSIYRKPNVAKDILNFTTKKKKILRAYPFFVLYKMHLATSSFRPVDKPDFGNWTALVAIYLCWHIDRSKGVQLNSLGCMDFSAFPRKT